MGRSGSMNQGYSAAFLEGSHIMSRGAKAQTSTAVGGAHFAGGDFTCYATARVPVLPLMHILCLSGLTYRLSSLRASFLNSGGSRTLLLQASVLFNEKKKPCSVCDCLFVYLFFNNRTRTSILFGRIGESVWTRNTREAVRFVFFLCNFRYS